MECCSTTGKSKLACFPCVFYRGEIQHRARPPRAAPQLAPMSGTTTTRLHGTTSSARSAPPGSISLRRLLSNDAMTDSAVARHRSGTPGPPRRPPCSSVAASPAAPTRPPAPLLLPLPRTDSGGHDKSSLSPPLSRSLTHYFGPQVVAAVGGWWWWWQLRPLLLRNDGIRQWQPRWRGGGEQRGSLCFFILFQKCLSCAVEDAQQRNKI